MPAPTSPPSRGPSPSRDLFEHHLRWIAAEIETLTTYHHHKEAMAWSATAGYLAIIVLARSASAYPLGTAPRLVFTVAVLIALWATMVFLRMQFELRWNAADTIAALRRSRARLMLDPNLDGFETLEPIVPERSGHSGGEAAFWPLFVQRELEACRTPREPLRVALPKLLSPRASSEVTPRRRSEISSYTIVLLATALALLQTWFVDPPAPP